MDSSQFDNDPSVYKINCRNRKGEIIGFGIVDIEDSVEVSKHSWSISNGYLLTSFKVADRYEHSLLHHFVIGKPPTNMITDHINQLKYDNRKSNLRFVTFSQNNQNHAKQPDCSSKFYGVVKFDRKNLVKPWKARSCNKVIGYFKTEHEAAWAYDEYVKALFPNPQINGVSKPDNFEEYVLHKKKSHAGTILPQGVYLQPNGHFRLRLMKYDKIRHSKSYATLSEALDAHKLLMLEIDAAKLKCVQDDMKKPICRNENGVAFLTFKNANVLLDDDIYLQLLRYTRGLTGGYPTITIQDKHIMLHQWIMPSTPQNYVVDHKDRNILNAQRSNLRYVSRTVNSHNRSKLENASSRYFGVVAHKNGFIVRVKKDGKVHYGGKYKNERIAGFAADQLSLMLYQDKAKSNGINLPGYIFKNNRAVKIEEVDVFTKVKLTIDTSFIHGSEKN